MTRRPDAPFLRSRAHTFASFTTWRAPSHGLECAHDGKAKRTIPWRQIAELRITFEKERRDQRRRCDVTTKTGETFTIYGPAAGRLIDPIEGDYEALVRAIVARVRKANRSCRFLRGRFMKGLVAFQVAAVIALVAFVEGMGRFSGMKAEDPHGFFILQTIAVCLATLWTALVLASSWPQRLDPDAIPEKLLK